MGFPRQKYWSELSFPSPGDLLNPGIEPVSPTLAGGLLYQSHLRKSSLSKHLLFSKYVIEYIRKAVSLQYCFCGKFCYSNCVFCFYFIFCQLFQILQGYWFIFARF